MNGIERTELFAYTASDTKCVVNAGLAVSINMNGRTAEFHTAFTASALVFIDNNGLFRLDIF